MYEEMQNGTPSHVSYKNFFHSPFPGQSNLYFTKDWAKTGSGWASGKYFKIVKSIPVNYPKSYVLPGSDYKELDLSNASGGLKLYPEVAYQVMEMLVGFKDGNYVVQIDVPNGSYLAKLPEATMIPSKTDSDLKYLNAKEPADSPANNPTIKFWTLKDAPAIILRPVVLSGVDYERVTIVFKTVRHVLEELRSPPAVYDTIPYPEELRY